MVFYMFSGAPDDLSGVYVMVFIAFSGVHAESFGCQCIRSRGFGCSHRLGVILLNGTREAWSMEEENQQEGLTLYWAPVA